MAIQKLIFKGGISISNKVINKRGRLNIRGHSTIIGRGRYPKNFLFHASVEEVARAVRIENKNHIL